MNTQPEPTRPPARAPKARRGRRRLLVAALAAFLGAAFHGGVCRADIVHLKTGETVKGRPIQARSNDEILVVEDVLSGATRQFRWDVVSPEDRERIRIEWGFDNRAASIVKGVRLVQRLEGGDTAELYGVVEKQDASGVSIRSDGQLHWIPRPQVVGELEPVDLDPRTVWTPQELWAQFLAQLKTEGQNPDAPDSMLHWRMAQYAEWVDFLEPAKEHYAAAAADTDFARSEVAQQRLARVEELLRDKEARAMLIQVKTQLANNLFRRARALLEEFPQKHPNAGEAVKKEHEKLQAKAKEQRTRYFQVMASREFPDIVEDLIRIEVKSKDEKGEPVTLSDVTSWTRKKLPEDGFAALAARMSKRDDVTPDEARTFWEGRPKRWIRKSYSDGSFIVNPPKIKPPKPRKTSNAPKNPKSGPQAKIDIPKPPTRDQWWEKADNNKRVNWVFAFFGENSELFEVGAREPKPCSLCQGTGLQERTDQTGQVISFLCTRCAGSQSDIVAKFR